MPLFKSDTVRSSKAFMRRKGCHGSMTVEAAIVLPLFLFFFFNLLSVIEIFRLQSTLRYVLREVGSEMSVYAYAYDAIMHPEEDSGLEALVEDIAFSYLYVKARVETMAGAEYLEDSPLTYGKEGILYLESSFLQEDDVIDLILTYRISPLIDLVGFRSARFYSRYYARAWTGYEVAEDEEESKTTEYVYVADYAEVYHFERSCTHILLSVRECRAWEIEMLRNESGEKYSACERCASRGTDLFYITPSGDRYHTNPECGGLKRTIRKITRAEAESRYRMCGRCGR